MAAPCLNDDKGRRRARLARSLLLLLNVIVKRISHIVLKSCQRRRHAPTDTIPPNVFN